MKKYILLLSIFKGAIFCFGQEPCHYIHLTFVDLEGRVIKPDITVKSRSIKNNLELEESKTYSLKMDSIKGSIFGPLNFNKSTNYSISSFTYDHWLDPEYEITLSYNQHVMNIHVLTNGGGFTDTIPFETGRFFYFHQQNIDYTYWNLNFLTDQTLFNKQNIRLTSRKAKLLPFNPEKEQYCLLNCEGEISRLDPSLEQVLLKSVDFYSQYLIVNNIPIGLVERNENQLFICYLSEEIIRLLKENAF